MSFFAQFALVFVALVAVDYCWAQYISHASAKNATKAAAWAAGIIVAGACATVSYVQDHRLIVAAVLGSFVGTYIAIKRAK
jgi:hypothetical protein